MGIRKTCLGHGKAMEFRIFPKIVLRNLGNFVLRTLMFSVFTSPLVNFQVMGLD